MVTTVTTTVSTVVSTASMATLAFLGLAVTLTLIAFLITKELVTASDGAKLNFLGRRVDMAIFPLLFMLSFIVIDKVAHILF